MLKSIALLLIVASSSLFTAAQVSDAKKESKAAGAPPVEKIRDLPFPAGVDLQFLIRELARDMDINVLFDPEFFRSSRKTNIELRNITADQALKAILLQEGLVYEDAGPRTILITGRFRGTTIPQIGIGLTLLTPQLNQYFGVESGILINNVTYDSPAAKAGLKAGDVIVEIDGTAVWGPLNLHRVISEKSGANTTLKVVRDRKGHTFTLMPQNGIK